MSKHIKILSKAKSAVPAYPVDPLQMFADSKKQPFDVAQMSSVSNQFDVYLSQDIGPVHEYVELFMLLKSCTENDRVTFHINCPGGSVDTGLQIISHMNDSAATIVTATYGTTASMGTAIFLSGDEFMVGKHSRLMIHNFSGAVGGKGHEMQAELHSTVNYVKDAFRDIHVPFVTEDEYADIMKGSDLWLHDEDIIVRLEKLAKFRQIEQVQQQIQQCYDNIVEMEEAIELLEDALDDLTGTGGSVVETETP